jgi:hypothetical protein
VPFKNWMENLLPEHCAPELLNRQLRRQVIVAAVSGGVLSSPTDGKPQQRAADDQHDDHNQNELTDTGEKTSGLKLGGEQANLSRSEDHDSPW